MKVVTPKRNKATAASNVRARPVAPNNRQRPTTNTRAQKPQGPPENTPHALKILSDSLRGSLVELYDKYYSHKVLDGVVHFYIAYADVRGTKLLEKVEQLADEANALENGFRSIFSYIELSEGILYEMDIRFVESLHRYKLGLTKPCSLVADLKEIYRFQSIDLLGYIQEMKPSKNFPLPIIINAERLPNCHIEIYRDLDVRETLTVEAFQLNLDHVVSLIKKAKLVLDVQIVSYTEGRGLLVMLKVPSN